MIALDDPDLLVVLPREEESDALLVDAVSRSSDCDLRIVSITACSLLASQDQPGRPGGALHSALHRGARCRLVVLDPNCAEADVRMSIESPGVDEDDSVLRRDAQAALGHLAASWSDLAEHLIVRQSPIGLGFNLWLTPLAARVEPYHLGQTPDRRGDPYSPFEGLVHLWFGHQRPEYALLADHFNQLWARSTQRWPRQEIG